MFAMQLKVIQKPLSDGNPMSPAFYLNLDSVPLPTRRTFAVPLSTMLLSHFIVAKSTVLPTQPLQIKFTMPSVNARNSPLSQSFPLFPKDSLVKPTFVAC
jgi:hypothetical protein